MSKTPPSAIRSSVAETLLSSVEKLKISTSTSSVKKSRQRLFEDGRPSLPHGFQALSEHAYSSKVFQSDTTSADPKLNRPTDEEFITERLQCDILPAIDESLKDVARLGRSVLFIKDCKDLCEKDWFRDMLQRCTINAQNFSKFYSLLLVTKLLQSQKWELFPSYMV
ncbi:uncharacterized protein LOC117318253 [Pecten maximus]|uniref:uncharacterized protein LOC117318253 n=1 Tax=Pecten maximus TaxID=6579 RepID=UPI001458322D|nr:uncharacterized protein LOC117318253 [Pecten maximus]